MACSVQEVFNTVKQKPALAFSVVGTPVGALGLLFFLFTSMEGVKSLTGSDSIFAIFKESWKGIQSLFSPLIKRTISEAKGAQELGLKELGVWLLTFVVVSVLLISLSSEKISWLSLIVSILFGLILIAVIGRYGAPKWFRAIIGGGIVGASVGLILFLVRQVDAWSSKKVLPDVIFISMLVYFIFSGLALWNNYLGPRVEKKSDLKPQKKKTETKQEKAPNGKVENKQEESVI